MSFFSKKKQPLTLPGPAFSGAAETTSRNNPLREKFKRAKFGHICRTLTLRNPEGDNLNCYRQMVCLAPGDNGWRVIEISDYPTETGEVAQRNKTVKNQLCFLDAIENLATWQAGQIKLGYVADSEEAEKLGLQYFIKFGERENLAFDIHGQPHTTLEGEVVTDGYFTEKARENAKASIAVPPPQPPQLPAINLFTGINYKPVDEADLSEFMQRLEQHAAARDLLDDYKQMTQVLKTLYDTELANGAIPRLLCFSNHQFSAMSTEPRYTKNQKEAASYLSDVIGYSQTVEAYINRKVENCLKSISSLGIDQQGRVRLSQMTNAYKVVYYALASKYTHELARNTTSERASVVNQANQYAQAANSAYYYYNRNNEDVWKIQVFILQDESPLKVPDIFDEFIQAFEISLNEAGKNIEETRKKALSPPVALALPKPQNP